MKLGNPIDEVVLANRWFQIVARSSPGSSEPHYCLKTLDYVGIVATNPEGELLLVRQFRPVLWQVSLEIPSGHVELGQTPEQAARAELLEETGHEAEHFEFLANVSPDTGRLSNRLWCFFAANAVPTRDPAHQLEAGIDFVRYRGTVAELAQSTEFCSALHHAALFAAVIQGKLKI